MQQPAEAQAGKSPEGTKQDKTLVMPEQKTEPNNTPQLR